jgi:glycosyltransferase involved in cell wall biosynthesis
VARILIVASFAPSLTLFRGDLIDSMRSLGHEVIATCPDPDAATVTALAVKGVKVVPIRLSRNGMNPLADIFFTMSLTRLVRQLAPDVLFTYTPKPVVFGGFAARLHGRAMRSYAMVSGLGYGFGCETWQQRVLRTILIQLYRRSLSSYQGVFFQNPDDLQLFADLGIVRSGQPILVRGSGVDVQRFRATPLPPDPVFLLVARLIPEKGIREYVAAARIVKQTVPAARFLLAGWVEDRSGAISRAELDQWVAEGCIEYLGVLKDVRPAFEQARVCVLPSYYGEGIPRSLLEAMSMGRPIITTDMPGCRETVVNGENGVLIPPRDSARLADAMITMALQSDRATAMGASSRRLAEAMFSVTEVNRMMLRHMAVDMTGPAKLTELPAGGAA